MAYRLAFGGALVAALAIGGWFWFSAQPGPPEGFAVSNGRIEATRIDVATRFGGRVAEVLAREGDLVEAGQVVARMDATQIRAQLREAEAGVRQAEQGLVEARAMLAQRRAELVFADEELKRAAALRERAVGTVETLQLRRAERSAAAAAVTSAEAGVARAEATIDAARATADRLRADLAEYDLVAPRAGRVQYRLAEPGEVLAAGDRVATLLDLTDVYMAVYLPTDQVGRLRYGAEARIVLDAAPDYVIPAEVTFVASEAQFTPKYVETASERAKLMFRVQVTIPPDLLRSYRDVVKTGVPGVAYVRIDPAAPWPPELATKLPDVG